MSNIEVVLYGASGYTGEHVMWKLAERGIPFIAAGRNKAKLERRIAEQPELANARYEVVEVAHDEAALTALFGASIDVTRRQIKQAPLLFELSMAVTREMPALRIQVLGEIRRMIREILEAGQARGEIPDGDAAERAELILFAGAPFVMPWLLLNQPFGDPRNKVAPLMHCLVAGLTAPAPTASP